MGLYANIKSHYLFTPTLDKEPAKKALPHLGKPYYFMTRVSY